MTTNETPKISTTPSDAPSSVQVGGRTLRSELLKSATLPGTPMTFELHRLESGTFMGRFTVDGSWHNVIAEGRLCMTEHAAREWLNDQWEIMRATRDHFAKVERNPSPSFGPGFYEVEGTIFKIRESAKGNLYAEQLNERGTFDYAPGVVRMIRAKGVPLTTETAAAYGHRYGICARCGATLSDPESIARGIGPVCATKF